MTFVRRVLSKRREGAGLTGLYLIIRRGSPFSLDPIPRGH
jgi:hypothetical protein